MRCVLAIGGLDPGGGAGLAADVRALTAAGAFAAPVAATITVQSTDGLVKQAPVAAALVRAQALAVLRAQNVGALKTGALGDAKNVRVVAELAASFRSVPLIVDPVRLATKGRVALHGAKSMAALRGELVPLATLVTANVDEAAQLTGIAVRDVASATRAARAIVALGARAALVKGGHLASRTATDVLVVGDAAVESVFELSLPRLASGSVHGGGCLLASLIAARLAQHDGDAATSASRIVRAVRWSKARHHRMLARGRVNVGGRLLVGVP